MGGYHRPKCSKMIPATNTTNDCTHPVLTYDGRDIPHCGVCGSDLRTVDQ